MKKNSKTCLAFALILMCSFIIGANNLAAQEKKSLFNEKVYMEPELVLIKGGEFTMGREIAPEKIKKEKPFYWDNPAHKVTVDSFYIDKYEVTNYQYYCFCKATGRKLPMFWGERRFRSGLEFPNHPVVGVSCYDANAYAKWRGMRLPTEAEWEYAARGGVVGKKYANGDTLGHKTYNSPYRTKGPESVGGYPANGYGLHDMTGNVAEWTADFYDKDYYRNSPAKNPKGPELGKFRVFRGGGWHTGPGCSGVAYRNSLKGGWLDFNVGFRCVKDSKKQ